VLRTRSQSSGSGRDREDLFDVKAPGGQSPQQLGVGLLKIEPGRTVLAAQEHDLPVMIGAMSAPGSVVSMAKAPSLIRPATQKSRWSDRVKRHLVFRFCPGSVSMNSKKPSAGIRHRCDLSKNRLSDRKFNTGRPRGPFTPKASLPPPGRNCASG
jgi:hypothetical protein